MREPEELERFERIVMPHLGAGYNLARWLTRNDHDAEDVVQEAYLRALRSFDRYRGGDSRSWVLTIVRNTCYTWLRQNRALQASGTFAGETSAELADVPDDCGAGPEAHALRNADSRLVHEALAELAAEFREAIVLRELEGLSYKEIAAVTDVPLGTVMSRLARARKQLQQLLLHRMGGGT